MKQPSKETKIRMLKFFLEHSVPRILEDERRKKEAEKQKSSNSRNCTEK